MSLEGFRPELKHRLPIRWGAQYKELDLGGIESARRGSGESFNSGKAAPGDLGGVKTGSPSKVRLLAAID